jgi:hypothetical protein
VNSKEKLYIASEDLYRIGNSASPTLSKVRPREVTITTVNGIEMIVANNQGISLYNKIGLDESPLTGWIWEIKANTVFPFGLKLIKDDDPIGHYTLAPLHNMPFHEYIGLLEKVAIHCRKVSRKTVV